ncbi:hypothetical protein [Paenibacillus sp. FSL L8-0506]|uniref:hypothetical protein n=1 Tax=Paenibacillus sp. FSL L8-0506 TaxID=2975335 RepID=UPI0030F8294D
MYALKLIRDIKKFTLENYGVLKKPIYGDYPGLKAVVFMSRTLSSHAINGGAGDRDLDQTIAIKDGEWIKMEFEAEISGIGAPFKLTKEREDVLSDEDVEAYLNASDTPIGEVVQFFKKYTELRKQFENNIPKIDVFYGKI